LVRPILYSGALLAILVSLLALTDLGDTYPQFADSAIRAWQRGHPMTFAHRQRAIYHETFRVLMYIRECSSPDAVILLPPREFIIAKTGEICLLASPSSCYNFIHPRVPIHYGDPLPRRDRVTHLLIWEHWGLDMLDPPQSPSPLNRVDLIPIPEGQTVSW
jgi:hypothetical protein